MGSSNNTTGYGPYDQPIPLTPMQQTQQKLSDGFVKLITGKAPDRTFRPPSAPQLDPIPQFNREYVSYIPQQREQQPLLEFQSPNYSPVEFDPTFGRDRYTTGGGAGNLPAQQSSQNFLNRPNAPQGNKLQQAFQSEASQRSNSTRGAF